MVNKKHIIVLNGDMPSLSEDFFESAYIVCADGAYRHLENLGIKPNVLIGDLDSIKTIPHGVDIIQYSSDKDSTDGQLALMHCIGLGASEVLITGAAGGREDHFMGNLALLWLGLENGIETKIITQNCTIWAFSGKFETACTKNKYFSIVPFSGTLHIINTEGLKYKVSDKILKGSDTLGISNYTVAEKVIIETAAGVGLAFLTDENVKKSEVEL